MKRLQAAAKRMSADRVCFFGFQQRWSPEYLAAEKLLRDGKIGELLLMRAEWMVGGIRFGGPVPTQEQAAKMWYPWRAKSGDFIVEQDCHGVDVLNWFAQSRPESALGGGGKGNGQQDQCAHGCPVLYRGRARGQRLQRASSPSDAIQSRSRSGQESTGSPFFSMPKPCPPLA